MYIARLRNFSVISIETTQTGEGNYTENKLIFTIQRLTTPSHNRGHKKRDNNYSFN